MLGYGGGMQVGIKGGSKGIIFIDINYMYFGDAVILNPDKELYPEPPVIYYKRSVIGLGIGYKFGYFNRK
jgi:hypothetical protein